MNTTQIRISKKEEILKGLQSELAHLENEYASKSAENDVKLDANALSARHIANLKTYNELRDTGLRLAQMIADEKACKIKDVFEEMGYEMSDNM
ncbi:LAMI_0C02322g1_1 [Lachancea mirantina]|uniref:LAMI_0C02322g1_1 n=1 Tax=Lachancea mirantina TaxID=1230905 RepID=A0A1G4J1H6_9SACH|nr:LAMI_0C02322g1_1 [Lachancea mirantina]